jgi:hypothetical protein
MFFQSQKSKKEEAATFTSYEKAETLYMCYKNRDSWLFVFLQVTVMFILVSIGNLVILKETNNNVLFGLGIIFSVAMLALALYFISGFHDNQTTIKILDGNTKIFNSELNKDLNSAVFYQGQNEPLIIEFKDKILESLKTQAKI